MMDYSFDGYAISDLSDVLTPALAIYTANVANNIDTTIALLGNNPARWRPHLKTTKLSSVMHLLVARGVKAVKCATTLEFLRACEAGFDDVLLAYPVAGNHARRAAEIALAFPTVTASVLVDSPLQVQHWCGSRFSVFIDVDPGMKRTGIPQAEVKQIVELARQITESGIRFRGIHCYDGHLADASLQERTTKAHACYDQTGMIVQALEAKHIPVEEVITTGTPTFPCALSYLGFAGARFIHRVSPGTLVFCDLSSLAVLPASFGYRLAALVLARVVSATVPGRFTCDAGHKSVSADAGVPTCQVLGRQGLVPSRPSEEHLPVEVTAGATTPGLGELLYLVPKHICPTVNNFSRALIIQDGKAAGVEMVSARGHEGPVWYADSTM